MSDKVIFTNLQIEISQNEREVTYRFTGDVDENFRHADVPRISKPIINFELSDIRNFNSCGIREWIFLIKDVGALGHLYFRHCSVAVIDQVNMVPDSLGAGEIDSFYAPYYCQKDGEVNQLIEVNKHQDAISKKVAPQFNCPHCNAELEFDALEESYFLFADNQKVSEAS